MGDQLQLAPLQLAIMQVLWELGEASVGQVRQALLPDRELAHTTVGTMLAKMEANGQVDHRTKGRSNIYRPLIAQADVSTNMVSDLTERLFHGDVSRLMCSLLDGCEVSSDELHQLKKLIRDKERELKNG